MKYGRSDTEWSELVETGRAFLEERARLATTTSYTEMNTVLTNRTGQRLFDFDRKSERTAMGYLLCLIVEDTFPQTGVMLSALVQYLNANDAGHGFYQLAQSLGLLRRGASPDEKLAFWSQQVAAVHAHYTAHPRRR